MKFSGSLKASFKTDINTEKFSDIVSKIKDIHNTLAARNIFVSNIILYDESTLLKITLDESGLIYLENASVGGTIVGKIS